LITFFTCACGGPLTIKDKKFKASNACDGEGEIEFFMQNGELVAKARSNLQTYMKKIGLFSAWCHGIKQIWKSKATYAGYTFDSSIDEPLQFKVDRNKGYCYLKGKGTVTTPVGKVIKLP